MIRATALLACLLLAACGQKGALYIPDAARPVTVPTTPEDAGQDDTQDEDQQQDAADAAVN
jgi:predicted small lipoprotein YifL